MRQLPGLDVTPPKSGCISFIRILFGKTAARQSRFSPSVRVTVVQHFALPHRVSFFVFFFSLSLSFLPGAPAETGSKRWRSSETAQTGWEVRRWRSCTWRSWWRWSERKARKTQQPFSPSHVTLLCLESWTRTETHLHTHSIFKGEVVLAVVGSEFSFHFWKWIS